MKAHVLKFVVRPDIYPYKVAFWFGKHDEKEMRRWLLREKIGDGSPPETMESDLAACCDLHGATVIWMAHEPNRITEAGTLVHESVHAAFNAASYLGFSHSEKSEEFYTYLIQYLVTEAMRHLAHLRKTPR